MLFSFICSAMCASAIRFIDVNGSDKKQYANIIIDNPKPGACIYLMENKNVNDKMSWTPCYVYKLENSPVDSAGKANVQLAIPEQVKNNCHYAFKLNNSEREEVYSKPFVHRDDAWMPSRSEEAERSLVSQTNGASRDYPNGGAAAAKKDSGAAGKKHGKKNKSKNSAESVFGSLAVIVAVAASVMVL
jgi:hypothetical protein